MLRPGASYVLCNNLYGLCILLIFISADCFHLFASILQQMNERSMQGARIIMREATYVHGGIMVPHALCMHMLVVCVQIHKQ